MLEYSAFVPVLDDGVYRGAPGQTTWRALRYSCPCGVMFTARIAVTVNATRDPDLAARLVLGMLTAVACPTCSRSANIECAVRLHDEQRRFFALVLPEALRHRELEERALLLAELAGDAEVAPPKYVRDHATLFGHAAVAGFVEQTEALVRLAAEPPVAERAAALDLREAALDAWAGELERARGEVERHAAQLDTRDRALAHAEAVRREEEQRLAVQRAELAERMELAVAHERASQAAADERTSVGPQPEPEIARASEVEVVAPLRFVEENLASTSELELVARLDDKLRRVAAALELCRRRSGGSALAIFAALGRMTRNEAAVVLPAVVQLGDLAVHHLVEGLQSKKSFVRHGSALALTAVGNDDAVEPLCDLLLAEPTEIWSEVARATGRFGRAAIMALAARVRDATADQRERVSWAFAHAATHGARAQVEKLAGGRDAMVAYAAREALARAAEVRASDADVLDPASGREHTVNRAFSHRFFESMRSGVPLSKALAVETLEFPLADAELLDEEDLELEAADGAETVPAATAGTAAAVVGVAAVHKGTIDGDGDGDAHA